MKIKRIGIILILCGIFLLLVTIYLYPPFSLPGSQQNPATASYFQTEQMMLTSKETQIFPQEFYVETDTQMFATQNTDEQVFMMTFQKGTHYQKSFVFKKTLTSEEYIGYASDNNVLGLWDIPKAIYQKPALTSTGYTSELGDMQDALFSTKTTELVSQGHNGHDTIVVIIDDFPSSDSFYDYIPVSWNDRIIHYPDVPDSGTHGIMTAGIVGGVSPNTKLYLIEFGDPIQDFQTILDLKQEYPNYDIISSNSYVYSGTAYYDSNHPVHRKILEVADNDIAVLFGAGNWAHVGEHNPQWTFEVGYDTRNYMFERDSEIGYPAVFDEVISVAGCNAFCDKILSYSSMGRGVDNNDEPDISAPTHHVYEYSPYEITMGTSASCPFMAGICANILSGKEMDTDRLVGSIHSYSTDRGNNGFDDEFGFGVVDAKNIFDNYDNWVPLPEENSFYLYISSACMLGIGGVLFSKDKIPYLRRN